MCQTRLLTITCTGKCTNGGLGQPCAPSHALPLSGYKSMPALHGADAVARESALLPSQHGGACQRMGVEVQLLGRAPEQGAAHGCRVEDGTRLEPRQRAARARPLRVGRRVDAHSGPEGQHESAEWAEQPEHVWVEERVRDGACAWGARRGRTGHTSTTGSCRIRCLWPARTTRTRSSGGAAAEGPAELDEMRSETVELTDARFKSAPHDRDSVVGHMEAALVALRNEKDAAGVRLRS